MIPLTELQKFKEQIAKAIVKKGYKADYQTAFDEYLADGKLCAIDKAIAQRYQLLMTGGSDFGSDFHFDEHELGSFGYTP